jgi:mRNA interferase MazF
MQAVLDEAIEHYQRDKFLDEVNAAYATLRNDAVAWKEELAERALWDNAIADGLKSQMSDSKPNRGDVWSINLDPTIGREQAGVRPALIVSVDKFNHGPADLVVVLPITSQNKNQPIHVPVKPPEGGLSTLSFIKCDDIRSVSKQRLRQFYGTVSTHTIAEVEKRIRILLNL